MTLTVDHLSYLNEEQRLFSIFSNISDFDRYNVVSDDGHLLQVYEIGQQNAHIVILFPAVGTSFILLSNIARYLCNDFHVITWETRGLPNTLWTSDALLDVSLEQQTRDVDTILARYPSKNLASIVAYCSGSPLALSYAASRRLAFSSLILVSPLFYISLAYPKNQYEEVVLPLWSRVAAEGKSFAEVFRRIINQGNAGASQVGRQLASVNRILYRSDDSTLAYAQQLMAVISHDSLNDLLNVHVPLTLINSKEDEMVNWRVGETIAESIAHCKSVVYETGDHFMVYSNQRLFDEVKSKILNAIEFDWLRNK